MRIDEITAIKAKLALLPVLLFILTGWTACPPATTDVGGFFVYTEDVSKIGPITSRTAHGGVKVTGSWNHDLDNTAAGQELTFDIVTPFTGQDHIVDGRLPAAWDTGVFWNTLCGGVSGNAALGVPVTRQNPYIEWDCVMGNASPAAPSFALSSSLPASISIPAPGLTTSGGMPQIRVYDKTGAFMSSSYASAVPLGGSSATFVFPTNASGGPLTQGMYNLNIWNQTSPGNFADVGDAFFGIGAATALAGAFGTDAADVTVSTWSCAPDTGRGRCVSGTTTTSKTVTPTPMFTQYYANQVSYRGHTFSVGREPVAIKAYGTASVLNPNLYYNRVTTTGPYRAIVANLGSGNVSILDLAHNLSGTTITVGMQPIAIAVNSAGKFAYVANFGSGTVSEVDLTNLHVSRTVTVGSSPESVAVDPSGSALWVGGNGYLEKVNLTSFAVTATQIVSGSVKRGRIQTRHSAGGLILPRTLLGGWPSLCV
jgi:YVTN family beta-propeller protein